MYNEPQLTPLVKKSHAFPKAPFSFPNLCIMKISLFVFFLFALCLKISQTGNCDKSDEDIKKYFETFDIDKSSQDLSFIKNLSVEKLLEHCRLTYYWPVLYILARNSQLHYRIKDLKADGKEMDSWLSKYGLNALLLCAFNGHLDAAKLLIQVR